MNQTQNLLNSQKSIDELKKELKENGVNRTSAEEMLHQIVLLGDCTTLEKTIVSTILKKNHLDELFLEVRDQKSQIVGGLVEDKEAGGALVYCKGLKKNIKKAIKQLEALKVETKLWKSSSISKIWFPRHILELNQCCSVDDDVEPHLDSNHPGFRDATYRNRRQYICELIKDHKIGETIPHIEYTEIENRTWNTVYNGLQKNHEKYACAEYLRCFKLLEEEKLYTPECIPQLQDISAFLERHTGFQLCPVAGLLDARDFLASLAFRVFRCTLYVRHHTSPMHTPEPDCCHELLGHVPMLCDPTFAEFSQEVGLASLGASDEDIVRLATLYWFTVEFGMCKENGDLKAYGAGLLSAFGELEHAVSEVPEHLPLDAETTSLQPYQDATYQPIYFVSKSFEDAISQVRSFSDDKMKRNFRVSYNHETKTVVVTPKIPAF